MYLFALVRNDVKKPVLVFGLCMGGYKGAFTLTSNENIFDRQRVYCFPDSTLTHLEPRREFHFRGNCLTRLPFASDQALGKQDLNLVIKWPKAGAGEIGGHRNVVIKSWLNSHGC